MRVLFTNDIIIKRWPHPSRTYFWNSSRKRLLVSKAFTITFQFLNEERNHPRRKIHRTQKQIFTKFPPGPQAYRGVLMWFVQTNYREKSLQQCCIRFDTRVVLDVVKDGSSFKVASGMLDGGSNRLVTSISTAHFSFLLPKVVNKRLR